jgi:serine/threonine-protein kinase PknK
MTPSAESVRPLALPSRYELRERLGGGGGGEVWSAHDRLSGFEVAVKLLPADAGKHELDALVREATMLSALEGLGVPRVVAFGKIRGQSTRFLVREMVPGISLEEHAAKCASQRSTQSRDSAPSWIRAWLDVAQQLTTLHRAGILHGDIKPANIVVRPDGSGTLVDLGLAVPLMDQGSLPKGLTPKFAAPELMRGAPLTVRTEVYSLAATLQAMVEPGAGSALDAIVARGAAADPGARFPSVDELAAAVKMLLAPNVEGQTAKAEVLAWPIVGFDATSEALLLGATSAGSLQLVGPPNSGRSTLLRRLSWMLGVEGYHVLHESHARLRLESEAFARGAVGPAEAPDFVLLDDSDAWTGGDLAEIVARFGAKTRLVEVRAEDNAAHPCVRVPPLLSSSAREVMRAALPGLAPELAEALYQRSLGLPGVLRVLCTKVSTALVTSVDDIDKLMADVQSPAQVSYAALQKYLQTGRFVDAEALLLRLTPRAFEDTRLHLVAGIRIHLAKGDTQGAKALLPDLTRALSSRSDRAEAGLLESRVALRLGDFTGSQAAATTALSLSPTPAIEVELIAVRAVAMAYAGSDDAALRGVAHLVLEDKHALLYTDAVSAHVRAVVLGSVGIVHQRAGRHLEAKAAYLRALEEARRGSDAWNVATNHLNLAAIVQSEGAFGDAVRHLESAIETGERAGAELCVVQAKLNLASLELHLGRDARAALTLQSMQHAKGLSVAAQAQLLGLRGELAGRGGQVAEAVELYQLSHAQYTAAKRSGDASEVALASLLLRARAVLATGDSTLLAEFKTATADLTHEHEALACLVEQAILDGLRDEPLARAAIERGVDLARQHRQTNILWQLLSARGELSLKQGSKVIAERDFREAIAILEESATKLSTDLREVFWADPNRKALKNRVYLRDDPGLGTPGFGLGAAGTLAGTITVNGGPATRSQIFQSSLSLAEDKLARVLEITRELARERSLPRLLEQVTDHAIGLVRAERGFIVLADADGNVSAKVARGPKGTESDGTFSRSVAERVLRSSEAVVSTSAQDDARLRESASVHELMIQSVACVPIRGAPPSELPIGALYLETKFRKADGFQKDLPMLLAFADQAAIAIENARLHEQNAKRAQELEFANVELEQARARLENTLERKTELLSETRKNLKKARAELRSHFGYGSLVGTSPAMRKLYALIERLKDTDVPVLITGESGTGKEVVARTIHDAGERNKAPYLGINCGAIPANLLESELFGHERGAFTGADRARAGIFRDARGGTILLDEVGEMPLAMQPGLLRVLQERKVRPLGASEEIAVDVRVLAATNRNLEDLIREGQFREDLFYRLQVVQVQIPSLRERQEDVPLLVEHFLGIFAGRYRSERKTVERRALLAMQAFAWPGNVRQLEHCLLNAWLLSEGSEIRLGDLQLPGLREAGREARDGGESSASSLDGTRQKRRSVAPASLAPPSTSPPSRKPSQAQADTEQQAIVAILREHGGNRVKAAAALGMPRRTFYRRLKEYGLL